MKHVYLNKNPSRSQTSGAKLTYDEGKKTGGFNYGGSNYANVSMQKTPNALDRGDLNADIGSPNMMSSFLDKSMVYPNTRASIKEVNAD
jgi:hypothetical protein